LQILNFDGGHLIQINKKAPQRQGSEGRIGEMGY